MDCVYCKKQLKKLKRDWTTRKYHKTCFKKKKDIWFVNKMVSDFNRLNISNFTTCSSSS